MAVQLHWVFEMSRAPIRPHGMKSLNIKGVWGQGRVPLKGGARQGTRPAEATQFFLQLARRRL